MDFLSPFVIQGFMKRFACRLDTGLRGACLLTSLFKVLKKFENVRINVILIISDDRIPLNLR